VLHCHELPLLLVAAAREMQPCSRNSCQISAMDQSHHSPSFQCLVVHLDYSYLVRRGQLSPADSCFGPC
jgi:hypothetical protein